ncbi:MAG TPA: hypothetical protein VGP76_00785 [Planctomycetaceae bacterium]|jgi:hypothetical protein|nr:hypothetical protein [Planctomycetaceae bacterium]
MQFLFAAMVVAVIVAVAWAIRWGVRRLGVNPSFLACVVIAIALLAYAVEFIRPFVPME